MMILRGNFGASFRDTKKKLKKPSERFLLVASLSSHKSVLSGRGISLESKSSRNRRKD